MQTILVHVVDDDLLTLRLETGLALARAVKGHLRCIHAAPVNAYTMFDMFGGIYVLPGVMDAIAEAEERLRGRVEKELGNEDVSWEYLNIQSNKVRSLAAYSTLADIVMVARDEIGEKGSERSFNLIANLLASVRSPIFVPSETGERYDPLKPVVIGWNGSREAANVVRSSLALLKLAPSVRLVTGVDRKDDGGHRFPATDVMEYLSRHGIHADLREVEVADEDVPELLISQVNQCDASTLMIGGYGHRRVTEFLFGGVTRTFLQSCPVALAVAH